MTDRTQQVLDEVGQVCREHGAGHLSAYAPDESAVYLQVDPDVKLPLAFERALSEIDARSGYPSVLLGSPEVWRAPDVQRRVQYRLSGADEQDSIQSAPLVEALSQRGWCRVDSDEHDCQVNVYETNDEAGRYLQVDVTDGERHRSTGLLPMADGGFLDAIVGTADAWQMQRPSL